MAKAGRKIGSIPWNKGRKTGLIPRTAFKKGVIPWNTGLNKNSNPSLALNIEKREKFFKEHPDRRPRYWLGRKRPEMVGVNNPKWKGGKAHCIVCNKELSGYKHKYCNNCKGKNVSGSRNWNWKNGITKEDRLERVRFRNSMQRKVFERDSYTCPNCGTIGRYLQVDHIKSWAEFKEERFNMDNCRTLCMECHYKITFGKSMPKGIKWGHNLSKRRVSP